MEPTINILKRPLEPVNDVTDAPQLNLNEIYTKATQQMREGAHLDAIESFYQVQRLCESQDQKFWDCCYCIGKIYSEIKDFDNAVSTFKPLIVNSIPFRPSAEELSFEAQKNRLNVLWKQVQEHPLYEPLNWTNFLTKPEEFEQAHTLLPLLNKMSLEFTLFYEYKDSFEIFDKIFKFLIIIHISFDNHPEISKINDTKIVPLLNKKALLQKKKKKKVGFKGADKPEKTNGSNVPHSVRVLSNLKKLKLLKLPETDDFIKMIIPHFQCLAPRLIVRSDQTQDIFMKLSYLVNAFNINNVVLNPSLLKLMILHKLEDTLAFAYSEGMKMENENSRYFYFQKIRDNIQKLKHPTVTIEKIEDEVTRINQNRQYKAVLEIEDVHQRLIALCKFRDEVFDNNQDALIQTYRKIAEANREIAQSSDFLKDLASQRAEEADLEADNLSP